MNNMKMVTILLIIMILLSFSGCINDDNKKPTITALEGREIADKKADKWKTDSKLTNVGSMGYHDSNGGAEKWVYTYISFSTTKKSETNVTLFKLAHVVVKHDNDTEFSTMWTTSDKKDIIQNWTIDSDKAVDIAKDNPKIKSYLDKYDDAMDDIGFNLGMIDRFTGQDNPNNDSATWSIGWLYNAGFDNPVSARIYIDAETGEVLYAEADE